MIYQIQMWIVNWMKKAGIISQRGYDVAKYKLFIKYYNRKVKKNGKWVV